nr:MAG TPA: hypothetical protein [Caudoviricetes sp.]
MPKQRDWTTNQHTTAVWKWPDKTMIKEKRRGSA